MLLQKSLNLRLYALSFLLSDNAWTQPRTIKSTQYALKVHHNRGNKWGSHMANLHAYPMTLHRETVWLTEKARFFSKKPRFSSYYSTNTHDTDICDTDPNSPLHFQPMSNFIIADNSKSMYLGPRALAANSLWKPGKWNNTRRNVSAGTLIIDSERQNTCLLRVNHVWCSLDNSRSYSR